MTIPTPVNQMALTPTAHATETTSEPPREAKLKKLAALKYAVNLADAYYSHRPKGEQTEAVKQKLVQIKALKRALAGSRASETVVPEATRSIGAPTGRQVESPAESANLDMYERIIVNIDALVAKFGDIPASMKNPVDRFALPQLEHLQGRIPSVEILHPGVSPGANYMHINHTYPEAHKVETARDEVIGSETGLKIRAQALKKIAEQELSVFLILGALSQLSSRSTLSTVMSWMSNTASGTATGSSTTPSAAGSSPTASPSGSVVASSPDASQHSVHSAKTDTVDNSHQSVTGAIAETGTRTMQQSVIDMIMRQFTFLPQPVQTLLAGYLNNNGSLLSTLVLSSSSDYIKDRYELLNFALIKGSQPPSKFDNILKFHSLKSVFESEKSHFTEGVAERLGNLFAVIDNAAAESDSEFLYSFFNSDKEIKVDGAVYKNIAQLLSYIHYGLDQALMTKKEKVVAEDSVLAKALLDEHELSTLLSKLPGSEEEGDQKVAIEVFENLTLPKRAAKEVGSLLTDLDSDSVSLKSLPQLLGAKLSLSRPEKIALSKLIAYHSAKQQFAALKSESAPLEQEKERLVEERSSVVQRIKARDYQGAAEGEELKAERQRLTLAIEQLSPSMSEQQVKGMERLFVVAEAAISGYSETSEPYGLMTFAKDHQSVPLLTTELEGKTDDELKELGLVFPVTTVLKTIQKEMESALKAPKVFAFSGEMKARIETLLDNVPEHVGDAIKSRLKDVANLSKPDMTSQSESKRPIKSRSLYLYGPSGTGKSTILKTVIEATGLECISFDKREEVTLEKLLKELDKCKTKNPFIFIDEAGETLSRSDDLQSDLRTILDPEVPIDGYDFSRLSFWMTGNEKIKSAKIASRTDEVLLDSIKPSIIEKRAMDGFSDYLDQNAEILNTEVELQIKENFKSKIADYFSDIKDQRTIEKLATEFAKEYVEFFAEELDSLDDGIKLDFVSWESRLNKAEVTSRFDAIKKYEYSSSPKKTLLDMMNGVRNQRFGSRATSNPMNAMIDNTRYGSPSKVGFGSPSKDEWLNDRGGLSNEASMGGIFDSRSSTSIPSPPKPSRLERTVTGGFAQRSSAYYGNLSPAPFNASRFQSQDYSTMRTSSVIKDPASEYIRSDTIEETSFSDSDADSVELARKTSKHVTYLT